MHSSKRYRRISLFMDYENVHNTLQKRLRTIQELYGYTPKIDYVQMVDDLSKRYGPLSRGDFIAIANFSHYDGQKGGLNKVAHLVHVDSFETRKVRQTDQPSAGLKFVMKNYADLRLAFEAGRHSASQPAELYIIASGDKIFASVGSALMQQGLDVLFLLPDPDSAAIILKEEFDWLDLMDTQEQTKTDVPAAGQAVEIEGMKKNPVDELCKVISNLRQEYRTPIPQNLIRAIFGTEIGNDLMQKAQGQGRVDVWQDAGGVNCISLQEERMFGKVVIMQTRQEFVRAVENLYGVVRIAEKGIKEPTPAQWRKLLQEEAKLSAREAKQLLNHLIELNIIRHGEMDKVKITLTSATRFINDSLENTKSSLS